ncbi:MAG TPA: hypothetical protein VGK24_03395 [Candidatus Angelobacter sp.]
MKFVITCVLMFAISGLPALASDEGGPSSAVAASPTTANPASPSTANKAADSSSAAFTTSTKLAAALPDAPVPAESLMIAPAASPIATISALVPPTAIVKLKTPPSAHRFFDVRNTLGLASLGASLTADALSTQKGLAYPGFHEMNPIARPFVQSRLGAAAYNAGSFALLGGLMYIAHKRQHHKLERILPFAVGGWETLLSARNYHVIANRK